MATIIRTDVTWKTGSIIDLASDLQIAHGAKVTIEPGVTVHGNGHQILVAGELLADGTNAARIAIDGTNFAFAQNYQTPGFIHLDKITMTGGSFLTPPSGYGSFELLRSKFERVSDFYIWYPTAESKISGNIFINSAGLSIGLNTYGLSVTNNTFVNTGGYYTDGAMIKNWANYGHNLTVTGNNFYSYGQTIINIPEFSAHQGFPAEGNYFGTIDARVINSLILDGRDSITRPAIIDYSPYLTEANPLAPRWTGRIAMWGTAGNDTFTLRTASDIIIEKASGGIDTVISLFSYTLPGTLENLTLSGIGNIYGSGNALANTIIGNDGKNVLAGGAGNDHLIGGGGADILAGDKGRDVLEGGTGLDKFVFRVGEFGGVTAATADEIVDFNQAERDRIDLSQLDANRTTAIHDPYTFIGAASFDGRKAVVRFEQIDGNTYVQGDSNGDGIADFWIKLDGAHTLTKADFVL